MSAGTSHTWKIRIVRDICCEKEESSNGSPDKKRQREKRSLSWKKNKDDMEEKSGSLERVRLTIKTGLKKKMDLTGEENGKRRR